MDVVLGWLGQLVFWALELFVLGFWLWWFCSGVRNIFVDVRGWARERQHS